jgi:hypothetical protein
MSVLIPNALSHERQASGDDEAHDHTVPERPHEPREDLEQLPLRQRRLDEERAGEHDDLDETDEPADLDDAGAVRDPRAEEDGDDGPGAQHEERADHVLLVAEDQADVQQQDPGRLHRQPLAEHDRGHHRREADGDDLQRPGARLGGDARHEHDQEHEAAEQKQLLPGRHRPGVRHDEIGGEEGVESGDDHGEPEERQAILLRRLDAHEEDDARHEHEPDEALGPGVPDPRPALGAPTDRSRLLRPDAMALASAPQHALHDTSPSGASSASAPLLSPLPFRRRSSSP